MVFGRCPVALREVVFMCLRNSDSDFTSRQFASRQRLFRQSRLSPDIGGRISGKSPAKTRRRLFDRGEIVTAMTWRALFQDIARLICLPTQPFPSVVRAGVGRKLMPESRSIVRLSRLGEEEPRKGRESSAFAASGHVRGAQWLFWLFNRRPAVFPPWHAEECGPLRS
jgi:hypothetical protein